MQRLLQSLRKIDIPFWHMVSTAILGLDIKTAHLNGTAWPTMLSYAAVFPWVFTGYEFFLGDNLGSMGFSKQPWNYKVVIYLAIASIIIGTAIWLMQFAPEPSCSIDEYQALRCDLID